MLLVIGLMFSDIKLCFVALFNKFGLGINTKRTLIDVHIGVNLMILDYQIITF